MSCEIKLYCGTLTQVDDEDFLKFGHIAWSLSSNGYVNNTLLGSLHRLITQAPKGLVVDHKDKNKLNNQRYNLRVVSPQINRLNSKDSLARSLPPNIYDRGSCFEAKFMRNGIIKRCGTFGTVEEAVASLIQNGYFL